MSIYKKPTTTLERYREQLAHVFQVFKYLIDTQKLNPGSVITTDGDNIFWSSGGSGGVTQIYVDAQDNALQSQINTKQEQLVSGVNIKTINGLTVLGSGNLVITGSGLVITVVTNYSSLPSPNTVAGQFYWVTASQGTKWLPGFLGGTYYPNGLYYSDGANWVFQETPYQATQSAVDAGVIQDQFVTPATFANATKWNTKADVSDVHFHVTGEIPSGLINGINTTFNSAFNFKPESVEVFINGLKQKIIDDYNTSGTSVITLNFSPDVGEKITINYIKQ